MKLLKFYATWCGPCKALEQQLKEFDMYNIQSIDIDKDEKTSNDFNVRGIPLLVLVDDENNELWRKAGGITVKELENELSPFNKQKDDLITI